VLAALIRLPNLWLNGRLADQTGLPPEPPGVPAGTNPGAAAAQQWLVLEPNRIEKQYWPGATSRLMETAARQADLHRRGLGADSVMRPTPFWCLRRCCPGSFSALR